MRANGIGTSTASARASMLELQTAEASSGSTRREPRARRLPRRRRATRSASSRSSAEIDRAGWQKVCAGASTFMDLRFLAAVEAAHEAGLPVLVRHGLRRRRAGRLRRHQRHAGRFHRFRRSARQLAGQIQSAAVAFPAHEDAVLQPAGLARATGASRSSPRRGQCAGPGLARRADGAARERGRVSMPSSSRSSCRPTPADEAVARISAMRASRFRRCTCSIRRSASFADYTAALRTRYRQQVTKSTRKLNGSGIAIDGIDRSGRDPAALYARHPRDVSRDDAEVRSADRGAAV